MGRGFIIQDEGVRYTFHFIHSYAPDQHLKSHLNDAFCVVFSLHFVTVMCKVNPKIRPMH